MYFSEMVKNVIKKIIKIPSSLVLIQTGILLAAISLTFLTGNLKGYLIFHIRNSETPYLEC